MSYFILRAFIFSIFFSSFTFAESSIDKELLKIINDKTRIEKNSNRDKFRNPLETLKFFGLNRTNSVLNYLQNKYILSIITSIGMSNPSITLFHLYFNSPFVISYSKTGTLKSLKY